MTPLPPARRWPLALGAALVAIGCGAALAAVSTGPPGRIGPKSAIQPTGRLLRPEGSTTRLGNLPVGGALTRDGRFLWAISGGRGRNDVRIVRVLSTRRCRRGRRGARCRRRRAKGIGRVVQRIPMPGVTGGVAMAPDGTRAYVSGIADSPRKDQLAPGTPGRRGDSIHVFRLDRRSGRAARDGVIDVAPPPGTSPYQDFPVNATRRRSWPRDLAISRDGRTLLAALNLADRAAIVDTARRSARYVRVGHYPYGAAITGDGRYGLLTSETAGTVAFVDLAAGRLRKEVRVGPTLSHPEGMAVDPRRPRAYVALASADAIGVIDTAAMRLERTLSLERSEGTGTAPVALSVTRDGCDLLAADSGEDAVAVFALDSAPGCEGGPRRGRRRRRAARPFELVGRIPVGSYPTAVEATPGRGKVVWVSARGVGVGPNLGGPDPRSPKDSDDRINSFQYLPSLVRGSSGILDFPSDRRLRRLARRADRQLVPTDSRAAPASTPLVPPGPGQRIRHVFYVVKENRTYDQILGDDPRGDGDSRLTLFGRDITPNAHALAQRFPLLDHVYANSEASIDGHYWTAAGGVSDYVVKNWHQNYAGRGRPYDFGSYVVSQPPRGYLFQRAESEGVSYFNYGEALAGVSPLPDRNRSVAQTLLGARILLHSDIGLPQPGCYDSDISNSTILSSGLIDVYDSSLPPGARPGSRSRFDCFKLRFQLQAATGTVPALNYMVLPNNHTEGLTPGRRTPRAQIATNDLALGQIIDLISHSRVWDSSLILVIEDDSQDGADHVDAHRIPALAIGPYARRGAVIHTRYDQLSFLRTLEIVVGLAPRHLAESLAVPLYDAFEASPSNAEPYDAIGPNVSLTERNRRTAANARLSDGLNLTGPDRVPQRVLDRVLWRSVHGRHARPPPPGPNASGRDPDG